MKEKTINGRSRENDKLENQRESNKCRMREKTINERMTESDKWENEIECDERDIDRV